MFEGEFEQKICYLRGSDILIAFERLFERGLMKKCIFGI